MYNKSAKLFFSNKFLAQVTVNKFPTDFRNINYTCSKGVDSKSTVIYLLVHKFSVWGESQIIRRVT